MKSKYLPIGTIIKPSQEFAEDGHTHQILKERLYQGQGWRTTDIDGRVTLGLADETIETHWTVASFPPERQAHVWVVRQVSDLNEGRGPMKDVAICASEDEAFEANSKVCGVMGVPPRHGGEIWKVTLGEYPLKEEKVWGHRKRWDDKRDYGWLDLRDKPDPDDPEYQEFLRLKAKFESGVS